MERAATPKQRLTGVFPPVPTPFNHSGDLYTAKVRHNFAKWNLTSAAGYILSSHPTGELTLLTEHDLVTLWQLAAESAAPGRTLIAGISRDSVRESVHLAKLAAAQGYHFALAHAPLGLPHSNLYFQALADQSPIPVVIHNLAGQDLESLTAHPNIVGVLEPGQMLHAVPTLYSGTTGIPALLQQGAVGIASPIAAACPYACITIFEAILKREVDAAQDWQNRLLRFANLLDTHQLPALKYALDYNGFYGGPPRLPHLSVARAIQEQIEDALHGLRG